jgi:hypothetical protein
MAQNSTIILRASIANSKAADFAAASHSIQLGGEFLLGNGITDNLADLVYADALQIAASGQQLLDLNGSLVDALGQNVNFARVRGIFIKAGDANTNDVIFGNPGANAWLGPFGAAAHQVSIRPGGYLAMLAPKGTSWPVTPGTADIARFANGGAGTAVDVEFAIWGCSA